MRFFFWFILVVLGLRLRWLAWRNPGFRKQLENRDVIMQWRTREGSPARWYHFLPGKVRVGQGLHPSPSVGLEFEDSEYAVQTLKEASKNQAVFMAGMQQGKIKITGDPGHLMWFMTLLKFIAPAKKKK